MFLLSLLWAWSAWNSYHPYHGNPRILGVFSFIVGALQAEFGLHIIVIEVLLTAVIVASGGLSGFSDAIALLISLASWLAMGLFYFRAYRDAPVMQQAVHYALGENNDTPQRHTQAYAPALSSLLQPFRFRRPNVARHKNLEYCRVDGRALKADIYHHTSRPANAPVLLQIHGGGWMQNCGNKDQQGLVLMNQMAEKGWVCVAIEYRLSPKAAFPDHIIDCKRALAWIKANIKDYGGNPDFVVATGGSAGGHLSSLLALSANAPQFQPGFESADTSVRACVPFYGVMDFTDKQLLDDTLFQQHLSTRVIQKSYTEAPELWQAASPVHWVHENNTLPFLIIHGAADTLVPVAQSKALYRALRESGSQKVGYAELEDAQHAFDLSVSLRSQTVMHYVEQYLTSLHEQYQVTSVDKTTASKDTENLCAPPA